MKPILAQRLRAARQAITPEITQRDVAKHMNVSPSAVNLWEAGKTEPSASALAELSRLYHVSCDWLLGVDNGKPPSRFAAMPHTPGVEIHTVPVVPAAAMARWHWDTTVELLQTSVAYPQQTAAAMRVSSDALSSTCPQGCYVVISKAHLPEPGRILLAVVSKASDPVLRKYVREGGVNLLVADDTRFPTYLMDDGVRIIGVATEVIIRKPLI